MEYWKDGRTNGTPKLLKKNSILSFCRFIIPIIYRQILKRSGYKIIAPTQGVIILAFLFISQADVSGQSISLNNYIYRVKAHYGFIVPHQESIAFYVEKHIPGIDVTVGKPASGLKKWHKIYRMPETGVGYYFTGLGNPEIFGNAHSLYMYIRNPLSLHSKRVKLNNKFDFGLAYITKIYDLYENHTALAIGSHINAFIRYSLDVDIKITDNIKINPGISFGHFSNGRVSEPNLGLNYFTSSLGMSYQFFNNNSLPLNSDSLIGPKETKFVIIAAFGKKEISRRKEGIYYASSFIAEYYPLSGRRFRYGVGLDFFYDNSVKDQYFLENIEYNGKIDNYRAAAHLSYEIMAGRTSFVIQPGVYIWNKYKYYNLVSNRLALRYRISDHFVTNVSIKAHWVAIADYVEWGIGYTW